MDQGKIFKLLEQLTSISPGISGEQSTDISGEDRLSFLLKTNLQKAETVVSNDSSYENIRETFKTNDLASCADTQWTYVSVCCDILIILKDTINKAVNEWKKTRGNPKSVGQDSSAPPMSPETLSFSQQKTLATVIQFIVTLGLCPYLQQGVGIPLERRSGFAHMIKNPEEMGLRDAEKEARLKQTSHSLLQCVTQAAIGSVILSRHLGDLLGALIQICYSQSLPNTDQTNSQVEQTNTNVSGKEYFKEQLEKLTQHVYQPVLIRELLVLQGGAGPGPQSSSKKPAALVKSPVWLRLACGRILTDRLMQPKGVQNVLRGILDMGGPSQSKTSSAPDWRKCDAAAKIIATCPKTFSFDTYYKTIAPQILELLGATDSAVSGHFVRVAVGVISLAMSQDANKAEKYFFRPLLNPMFACLEDSFLEKPSGDPVVVVGEDSLSCCIETLHKLIIKGSEPDGSIVQCLKSFVHFLFSLNCFLVSSVSHLRKPVKDLLTAFLSAQSLQAALAYLRFVTTGLNSQTISEEICTTRIHPYISFSPGSQGGVVALNTGYSEFQTETCAKEVVQLLKLVNKEELTAEFFLCMLKDLTSLVSQEIDTPLEETLSSIQSSSTFLEVEDPQEKALEKIMRNLLILAIVAEMCENLSHSCFKRKGHILEFISVTLQRGVKVLGNTEDEGLGAFESEQLTLSMTLLSAVLSDPNKMDHKERDRCSELLPLLQEILDNHTNPEVRKMASDLRVAIATHGLVRLEKSKESACKLSKKITELSVRTSDQTKTGDGVTSVPHPSMEQKSHVMSAASQTERANPNTETSDSEPSDAQKNPDRAFDRAMDELLDPLIPVRGHALITLRKLVEMDHQSVRGKHEGLLQIFQENLQHEDTYIYLAAVQGLIAVADHCTDAILPVLIETYATKGNKNQELKAELRMKVGEVLMRVARNSGDMMPKYRDVFLNGVLQVANDKDPFVRASALSNLGEACRMLHFSLGSVAHEVVACISANVKTDPDANVRKAAAMVITLLLQGLGKDSLQVLGSAMRDLYHLLKHIASSEKDLTVKAHVSMALEEMDAIMKSVLFPKQELSKKIQVLDPPNTMDFS